MTEPEKPIHVLVAEALGWEGALPATAMDWTGYLPGSDGLSGLREIPRYDTDPAAWGPLVEEYDVAIDSVCETPNGPRRASRGGVYAYGDRVGVAICNLILLLAKEGKLKKVGE